jgi:hypothetical protein
MDDRTGRSAPATARQAAIKENQKIKKSKGKNLWAGPRTGLGRNLQGLAAIKTIVNDAIVNDSILIDLVRVV